MAAVTRFFIAGLMAMAVVVGFPTGSQAAPGDLTAEGVIGMEQIATCLRSNPDLAVLLVVDESGSLQDTDPENRRAEILADLVSSLANLSDQETAAGPRRVEFAVNTFAESSESLLPWTTLTPSNAPGISADLEAQLPGLNLGQATDYEKAIKAAASSMAQGVSRLGAGVVPCQIVIWFTDGVLAIGDADMNAASAERLCAPSGPVDALRAAGVHLLSVLLFDRSELDLYVPDDQEKLRRGIPLLQATAEGIGGSGQYRVECGQQPIPATYARGAFFEGSIDALASQFAQAIALGSGGTPISGLSGSPLEFRIDPGITSFRLIGLARQGLTLTSPSGQSITVNTGETSASIDGQNVSVAWTGPSFTLDVPVTEIGPGSWSLRRPGMNDAVGLYLFADLKIEITPVEFIVDEPAIISGRVVNARGSSANLEVFGSSELRVQQIVNEQVVEDPAPFSINPAEGTFSGEFVPQTDSLTVRFDIRLDLTTASGDPLAPISTTFIREVKLPGAYPSVAPVEIDFGPLQNREDQSTVELSVIGSPDGPSQVCVKDIIVGPGVPDAQLEISAQGGTGCIDLEAGQEATLPLTATLGSAVADGGTATGEFVLSLTNAPTDDLPVRERDLAIPYTVQVEPVGPVLWVPFALTALGVILPLIFLYAVNWWAAQLSLVNIMVARIPVKILDRGHEPLVRLDAPEKSIITTDDLNFVAAPARARRWRAGAEELRASMSWNPFRSVFARVYVPDGSVVTSNQNPVIVPNGQSAGIGMKPNLTVYLVTTPAQPGSVQDDESSDLDWRGGQLAGTSSDSTESQRTGELVAYIETNNLAADIHLLVEAVTQTRWTEQLRECQSPIVQTQVAPATQDADSAVSENLGSDQDNDPPSRFTL